MSSACLDPGDVVDLHRGAQAGAGRVVRAARLPPDPEGQVRPRRPVGRTRAGRAAGHQPRDRRGDHDRARARVSPRSPARPARARPCSWRRSSSSSAGVPTPASCATACREARVEGRFVGPDDEEHVLARVLPADGRSRAYVDGRLATAGELAEHRRDARRPARPARPPAPARSPRCSGRVLDRYAGDAATVPLDELRAARGRGAATAHRARRRSAATTGPGPEKPTCCASRSPRSTTSASPTRARTTPCAAEEALLADAVAIREALSSAYHDGRARRARRRWARRWPHSPIVSCSSPLHDRVKGLQAEVAELGHDLRDAADAVSEDPDPSRRPCGPGARLLRQLRRKYGEITRRRRRLRATRCASGCASSSTTTSTRPGSRRRIAAAGAGRRRGRRPRLARGAAGGRRGRSATRSPATSRELAMPRAQVEVQVEPGEPTDDGADVVTFLLAANPGESARPLAKAASGGELARDHARAAARDHRRAADARVRRGRRRHRRGGGHRRGPAPRRARARSTRCCA